MERRLIGSLDSKEYRLKACIVVEIEKEIDGRDKSYISKWEEPDIVAAGRSRRESIRELKSLIIATYETLKEECEPKLADFCLKQKKVLEEYVEKVQ